MVSKFALLSSLLLASMALALPSSRLEARLAHRSENLYLQPISLAKSVASAASSPTYSLNWAGATLVESNGTFDGVSATFTVPTPTGKDGSAAIWVGIDGYTCKTGLLQTGIGITMSNGIVSYGAWYEWYPDHSYAFSNFNVAAGDSIRITVLAYSTTTGRAIIENLTTNWSVQQDVNSTHPLCQQDADWIVEDYDGALVDFTTLYFKFATATGYNGVTYTPGGSSATIFDIAQNSSDVLTSVSIYGDSITVEYI